MKPALADAVKRIKEAGFDHIKVELEADIGRDGERYCEDCDDGNMECDSCSGEGYLGSGNYTRVSGDEVMEECQECYGEGRIPCDACDGTGNLGEFMSEETCEQFLKDYVSQEVRDRLVYGRFYEDGSVDSEFTFTVHIDHIEDVVEWMNAFKALSSECGYLEVADAGLHIAVLPTETEGYYPSNHTMPSNRVRNFTREVTKLMPALFFLASAGHQSRNLNYRHPRVDEDKYSAICTHEGTAYEFRVFETCYDKPESFYDYVETIANCLRFHADPTLRVNSLGKRFGFNNGRDVARFYSTPEQLRILNSTVKHLKPKEKTYKKLKEERGLQYTIKELTLKEKSTVQKLRQEYRQYKANWEQAWSRPLTEEEERKITYYLDNNGMDRREAEGHIRGVGGSRLVPVTEFIKSNMPNAVRYSEYVTV